METRILIAEDDGDTRAFLRTVLGRAGFAVDSVADGEEALASLRQRNYAAILLDLLMPRVNGFEVLQGLKALSPRMLPRVIVLTAAADQTLRYFDSGAVFTLLRKPVGRTALLAAVQGCTGQAQASVSELSKSVADSEARP